jgi:hypothetical protein
MKWQREKHMRCGVKRPDGMKARIREIKIGKILLLLLS